MTIFDYLKDIIITKKGDLSLDEYVPYLVTRWLSFINPDVAAYMNSANMQVLLESKELHYKTMIAMFPKMKSLPNMKYIKKIKEEQTEEDKTLRMHAINHELSKREIANLLSLQLDLT